jgi:hypothetical protein
MSKDVSGSAANGKPAKTFKVQIDKQIFEVDSPNQTARSLLAIAGKVPAENFALYKKGKGGQPERIPLDEKIDLNDPGIERFVTLPLDQTEGLGGRRDFSLPSEDAEWLESIGHRYELVQEGAVLRVVVYDWAVPSGYTENKVDVHVRIEPGYPDTQIDMVYFHPALARADGKSIGAASSESFDGKVWQRWSRHRTPANPWRPGVDMLSTHFALIDQWLVRELAKG